MSHLEILTLEELTPLAFSSFRTYLPFGNCPSRLRSFGRTDPSMGTRLFYLLYLTSNCSDLTHQRLQCLALSHRGDLSMFFNLATLLLLRFLVLNFHHGCNMPVPWPHQHLIKFLVWLPIQEFPSPRSVDLFFTTPRNTAFPRPRQIRWNFLGSNTTRVEDKTINFNLLEPLTLRPVSIPQTPRYRIIYSPEPQRTSAHHDVEY